MSEEEEAARLDTSIAVSGRMKQLEVRIGAFISTVRQNSKNISAWAEEITATGRPPSAGTLAAATVLDNIETASTALLSDFSAMLKKSGKTEAASAAPSSSPSSSLAPTKDTAAASASAPLSLLTVKQVEQFCVTHKGWTEIARNAASPFLGFFATVMHETGPVLPSDFVDKNQLLPRALTDSAAGAKENAFRFVRKGGGVFGGCCTGPNDVVYRNAVNKYNVSLVRAFLLPAELSAATKPGGAPASSSPSASPSSFVFSVSRAIHARGTALLRAVEHGWAPADVVCPIVIATLPTLVSLPSVQSENNNNNNNNGDNNYATSSSSSPSSSPSSLFNSLVEKFKAVEAKRVAGGLAMTASAVPNGDNNKEPTSSSSLSNIKNKSSSSSGGGDIWSDLEGWIHLVVTSHFHCGCLESIIYPRGLGTLVSEVLPRLRRVVWSARKTLMARVALEWSNFGVHAVDQLMADASATATIAVTDTASSTAVQIKMEEPGTPIRPSGREAELLLDRTLDSFIDRYKEQLSAAVRLSRGGASVDSASARNSSNSNNNKSNKTSTCCGFCTRGLALAMKRIVPETNDAQLIRTLQNKLRQKLIVGFAVQDSDKTVVKAMLGTVATQLWRLVAGGELAKDLEKIKKSNSEDTNNNNYNDNCDNDAADQKKKSSGASEAGADGTFSPAGGQDEDDGPTKIEDYDSVAGAGSFSSSSPSPHSRQQPAVVEDEGLMDDEQSMSSILITLQRAHTRVVLHAAAEMGRLTDALSELVVQRRCPEALKVFCATVVSKCQNVVQPHLLLQAQSLLTAKELVRMAEKVCDLGVAVGGGGGGATATTSSALQKRDASVVELGRATEQVQALLSKFPRSALEKPAPAMIPSGDSTASPPIVDCWDSDDENDNGDGKKGLSAAAAGAEDDFAAGNDDDNRNRRAVSACDDPANAFSQVLPLYKIKLSADVYASLVRSAE